MIDKRCSLLIGPNNVVLYDVTLFPTFCFLVQAMLPEGFPFYQFRPDIISDGPTNWLFISQF